MNRKAWLRWRIIRGIKLFISTLPKAHRIILEKKQFEGVDGHLFAIAANESFKRWYNGFLFWDAKNIELVTYYQEKFGATLLGMPHPYRMFIDEENANKLLEIYTLKGEWIMSEQEIKAMRELDELAEKAGGFVYPFGDNTVHYDYRKISVYCKERGIEPLDLTIRELSKFVLQ